MEEKIVLVDQVSRDIISQEIKTNLLVEAGAGSGKTSEMANRVVALVSNGYRKIGEIVAITFTKKAANELQERIRRKLEKEYEENRNPNIKTALDNYHECFIGTIHSFCTKLLKERPIEAMVDPEFEEIDDKEDERIRQLVWEEYVYDADEETKKLLKEFERFALKESALKNFLRIACDNQDIEYRYPMNEYVSIDEMISCVEAAFEEVYKEMQNVINSLPDGLDLGNENLDGLQRTALIFAKKTKKVNTLRIEDKIKILKMFNSKSSVAVTQSKWASDKEGKTNAKEIGISMLDLRENTIIPAIEILNRYIYNELLLPFVERAQLIYQKYKSVNSKMNFQDLLIKTMQMLKHTPEVRQYFQKKYKTLLVDEFQDTDPIQSQILMYLVGIDTSELVWNKLVPKEGSLFVVGDPKQSIYGFRRADIEIYENFKDIIVKSGGKAIDLVTNFRTVSALGNWYNNAFDILLNKEDIETENEKIRKIKQANFSNMGTVKIGLENTFNGVFYYEDNAKKVEEIIDLDGNNIVKIIKWLVNTQKITVAETSKETGVSYSAKPVEYKDIMILSIKKNCLASIQQTLEKEGIPVKVTGANIMEKTTAFRLIVNIVKMLAYPEENAYLHRVMSEYPFLFTAQDFVNYMRIGGKFSIYYDVNELLNKPELNKEEKELVSKIALCFEMLKSFAEMSKVVPCVTLIEKIIEVTGIQRELLETVEGCNEISSFTSMMEFIRMQSITEVYDLDKLAECIDNFILIGSEEESDITGLNYNAVRMMNVHKSKGLEAPIIILAMPCSGGMPEDDTYTERCILPTGETKYYGHVRLASNPESQYSKDYIKSDMWHKWEKISAYKSKLERDRLLYVAATRARNALIISNSTSKQNPWSKLVELLPKESEDLLVQITTEVDDAIKYEFSRELSYDFPKDESIQNINKRREINISANHASYNTYTPSTIKQSVIDKLEIGEDLVPDLECIESDNCIKVNFGEELKKMISNVELGTVIHKIFEIELSRGKAEQWFNEMIENSSLRDVNEEYLNKLIEGFRGSNLYERIQKSEKVYTEVPFSMKLGTDYISGKIDVVFYEDDSWVIIDYKTCESGQNKADLYRLYSSQLRIYKEAWKRIAHKTNVKTELFFIEKE